MKTRIIIATRDQFLIKLSTPRITSGNDTTDIIEFRLDKTWTALKTAGSVLKVAFYREDNATNIVKSALSNNNTVEIPKIMLTDTGVLHFGLFAETNNAQVKTSNESSYIIMPGIKTSASSSSANPIREADRIALKDAIYALTGTDYTNYTFEQLITEIANLEAKEYSSIVESVVNKLQTYYNPWYAEFVIDPVEEIEIDDDE